MSSLVSTERLWGAAHAVPAPGSPSSSAGPPPVPTGSAPGDDWPICCWNIGFSLRHGKRPRTAPAMREMAAQS